MEDRYLFKAKFDDSDRWVKGQLVEVNDTYLIIPNHASKILSGWFSTSNVVEVKKDTICQCTGLKDNNGNLIWENDVVAYWDTYSTESGYAEADCIGKVVWDAETISFQVTNRLSAESYEVLDECSVSGNKFDNPELLGVGL